VAPPRPSKKLATKIRPARLNAEKWGPRFQVLLGIARRLAHLFQTLSLFSAVEKPVNFCNSVSFEQAFWARAVSKHPLRNSGPSNFEFSETLSN
jgi:hypothetical protein